MEKKEQLYEGKAKKVYATEDPTLVIVSYKDDATALDGIGFLDKIGVILIMFETGSESMLGIIQSILSMYIMVRFLLTSKHLHNINFTIRSLVSIFLLSSKPGCRKIARYDVCLHSHQQASILKSIFISCPYSSS